MHCYKYWREWCVSEWALRNAKEEILIEDITLFFKSLKVVEGHQLCGKKERERREKHRNINEGLSTYALNSDEELIKR